MATVTASIVSDAEIVPHRFTADAWLLGERQQHHRTRDHFGIESDLYVVLSEDIGPYPAYTPVHWVIEDLMRRITALEEGDRARGSFVADACFIVSGTSADDEHGFGYFRADAQLTKTPTATFTADATFTKGGSFTAEAWIAGAFYASAYII